MLEKLKSKINRREAKIGIMGLGYVGLPLAVSFAKKGFRVVGIDIARKKVLSINKGRSYILDVPSRELSAVVRKKRLIATQDMRVLSSLDVVIICVPTPLGKTNQPDLEYVLHATKQVGRHLQPGQLIILESTSHPGTTDSDMLGILKKKSPRLRVERDYFLAFSPERVDPGNRRFNTTSIPKVVGGYGERSTAAAKALYLNVVPKVVPVSSARTAEMVKLLENTFRNVNIAFVNELTKLCHQLKVDIWEVIDAAKTKPFGFMPFYPGPGLGGHCIPIDPHYLNWVFKRHGHGGKLIDRASAINAGMPRYVGRRVQALLLKRDIKLKNARIHLLGVAYKKDVDDLRESPALEVLEYFIEHGAKVSYSDPHVSYFTLKKRLHRAKRLTPGTLRNQDCVVVLTNHSTFDYGQVQRHSKLVFDTRNAMRAYAGKPNVVFL